MGYAGRCSEASRSLADAEMFHAQIFNYPCLFFKSEGWGMGPVDSDESGSQHLPLEAPGGGRRLVLLASESPPRTHNGPQRRGKPQPTHPTETAP